MKSATVTLFLHPYKLDDPVLMLDLLHPREDGFWLLDGLLIYESQQWLIDLLAILEQMRATTTYAHHDMFSMYYYCISFCSPNLVDITHEYQPNYGFRLSYSNLAKVIKAILEYRNNPVERCLELILTDDEGLYSIPSDKSD